LTTIVLILLLGALTWAALQFGGRLGAAARVPLAAAIMLGLSGYLLVGSPGVASAPVESPEPEGFGEELTDPRGVMGGGAGDAAQWLGMADGLMRGGRTASAARLLQEGLRRYPDDIDLWVGYGNALVAHSGGMMTPASAMAFDRAAAIDPTHPAPPFFAGLALAQGNDLEGARLVWQQLLDRTPPDAPWREDLTMRLSQLPPPAAPTAGTNPDGAAAPAQGN
jgi:cytochrome c-type biogenesis protein CcmH